jgi:hypothetical protein
MEDARLRQSQILAGCARRSPCSVALDEVRLEGGLPLVTAARLAVIRRKASLVGVTLPS